MEKHAVSPTPENYALWYYYAAGKNKELVKEINDIIRNNLKFTPDTKCLHV